MQALHKSFITIMLVAIGATLTSFFNTGQKNNPSFSFPYKQAGLTPSQAAAHLLSRFTYGAKPGQVAEVAAIGPERWFSQQLQSGLADDSLNQRLASYEMLQMSNAEIVQKYPRPSQVLRMAITDGLINKDSVDKSDKKNYRDVLLAYMQQTGLKPQQELFRQLFNQKILRAAYTNNQLQEVLTDFWFNHFNVSITKNDCAEFIPGYEKDVIRPHALDKFETLLLATAKSPAMLMYLDNFSSAAVDTTAGVPGRQALRKKTVAQMAAQGDDSTFQQAATMQKLLKAKKLQGLNENYAREVMELHTLGVDGGYTQQDVTQAARVLTGWTVFPMGSYGNAGGMKKAVERIGEDKLATRGFIHEGDFLFTPNRHDNADKTVLGKIFPANGGYEEGARLLKMLAHHPSTAGFISKKLAVRFVSDNPPKSLIDKMAKSFTEHNGDIRQVLITMVSSPEFWSAASLRQKTKSPFELAISSVRSLNATITQPYQLYTWIAKMGQKMYYYQAPTGFPDKGQYWINTGALLNRMNFGLAFASQRIPGISINLIGLNNQHEPESAESALATYSKIMMPERKLDETLKRLTPLLNDPNLVKKVDEAAGKNTVVQQPGMMEKDAVMMTDDMDDKERLKAGGKKGGKNNIPALQTAAGNNSMLSQVVGIIIGSPEFQRR